MSQPPAEPCRITPATVSPSAPAQQRASVWANRNAASADVAARAPVLVERLDVTLHTLWPPAGALCTRDWTEGVNGD